MDPNTQDNTQETAAPTAAPTANTPPTRKRSTSSSRRVVARYRSFDRYLRILQKQVHPACKISGASITALNSIVGSLFKRIASEAQSLAQKQKRPTLLPRDIEFACRLILPEELDTEARAAGDTALAKYEETLKRDAARRT